MKITSWSVGAANEIRYGVARKCLSSLAKACTAREHSSFLDELMTAMIELCGGVV